MTFSAARDVAPQGTCAGTVAVRRAPPWDSKLASSLSVGAAQRLRAALRMPSLPPVNDSARRLSATSGMPSKTVFRRPAAAKPTVARRRRLIGPWSSSDSSGRTPSLA